jgi:uncharacterized membrane protein
MISPKTKIQLTTFEWMLNATSLVILLIGEGYAIISFNQLPNIIPIHFGPNGSPDGYGNRNTLWLLLGINLFTYLMMIFSIRYPALINYPFRVENHKNEELQFKNVFLMIRTLKLLIVIMFSYITYATIQTAKGEMSGLGTGFMLIFIGSIISLTAYFLYRGYLLSKD